MKIISILSNSLSSVWYCVNVWVGLFKIMNFKNVWLIEQKWQKQ